MILVVDGNNVFSRFWHANPIGTSDKIFDLVYRVAGLKFRGDVEGELVTFGQTLFAFDSDTLFRHQLDPKFKASGGDDSDLLDALEFFRDKCVERGVAVCCNGYLAADVLASYSKRYDGNVMMVTSGSVCRQALVLSLIHI